MFHIFSFLLAAINSYSAGKLVLMPLTFVVLLIVVKAKNQQQFRKCGTMVVSCLCVQIGLRFVIINVWVIYDTFVPQIRLLARLWLSRYLKLCMCLPGVRPSDTSKHKWLTRTNSRLWIFIHANFSFIFLW